MFIHFHSFSTTQTDKKIFVRFYSLYSISSHCELALRAFIRTNPVQFIQGESNNALFYYGFMENFIEVHMLLEERKEKYEIPLLEFYMPSL